MKILFIFTEINNFHLYKLSNLNLKCQYLSYIPHYKIDLLARKQNHTNKNSVNILSTLCLSSAILSAGLLVLSHRLCSGDHGNMSLEFVA